MVGWRQTVSERLGDNNEYLRCMIQFQLEGEKLFHRLDLENEGVVNFESGWDFAPNRLGLVKY
jgi:hypothetical protein